MWVNVKNTAWKLLPFVRKWATQPENESNLPIFCSSQAVMHLNVLIVQALWPYLKDILLEHFPECCLILPEVSGADLARLVSALLQATPPTEPKALGTHSRIVQDLHIPLDLSLETEAVPFTSQHVPPPPPPPPVTPPAMTDARNCRAPVLSSTALSVDYSSANEDTFLLSDVDIDSLSEDVLNENFSDQNARLVCLICYKIFGSQEHVKYKEHMTRHSQLELKKVPIRAPPLLRRHNTGPTTRSTRAGFVCNTCDRHLASSSALIRHQRLHNAQNPTQHQCDQCQKSFSDAKHWRMHIKTPSCGLQSRTCEICQKVLVDKTRLMIHMRTHSGQKPFHCTLCDKSFSQKRSLIEHHLVHEKTRRFKCDICDRSFVQKNHFKYHMASVHNQLPDGHESKVHSCRLCGKFFAFQFQLKKHEETHRKKLEEHFQEVKNVQPV